MAGVSWNSWTGPENVPLAGPAGSLGSTIW